MRTLVFSPDHRFLAVGASDKSLTIWEWALERKQVIRGFGNTPTGIAFSPDAKTIITVFTSLEQDFLSVVQHWAVASGKELKKLDLEGGGANRALSLDGTHLVTVAGFPNKVGKVWNLNNGKHVSLEGHPAYVHCAAISPDIQLVATAAGMIVKLWKLPSGKERWSVTLDDAVRGLVFSPDGKTLLTHGSPYKAIRFWDVATGKENMAKGMRGGNASLPMQFLPDGKFLAFANTSKEVELWNLEKGALAATFPFLDDNRRDRMGPMAFSRDGRLLAVGGAQGLIRIYDVPRSLR